jgi:hypothetical protein
MVPAVMDIAPKADTDWLIGAAVVEQHRQGTTVALPDSSVGALTLTHGTSSGLRTPRALP